MKRFLLFFIICIVFATNAAFAEVYINENDAKLFQDNGFTYDDVNNTVEHYRSIGLNDDEIQNNINQRITEFKMNNDVLNEFDMDIPKSQYEINLEKLKNNQYLKISDKRNEKSPVFTITKDELKICEEKGITKYFLNDILIISAKAEGVPDEKIYRELLEFIADKKINKFQISDVELFICKIMGISQTDIEKNIKDYIIKGYDDSVINDKINFYLLEIKIKIAIICFVVLGIIYGIARNVIKVIRNKKMKKISINNYLITGLITFGFLFYTVICQPSEYGCYQVLRWLVSVFSAWTSVKIYQNSPKSFWLLLFAALTIIFNPVLPLKFEDDTWVIIDIITLAIFFIYCVRNIIKNME